ncbi:uroporphyrinogen-III synthase [secondary endosymbiont of Ctenarytaina eucalypti]|uniref:Uroporphyrinogen-III synthase n=1 Tax=secondary endosymbiont of Ctenarytaina eucalypti TaxID=1199245 RepID=J3TXC6_9ENTR|nr:uroporphyrinogen-III synthase [secondary endosymbiont of Ctenarytaina eucalypti]AFP84810.1 uroporphyrinogen-III synthase [secondary endosymbiont of Ctenarytaina eucalypti]
MSILVTRPAPAGEQLVRKLHARGKTAWHLPLINFTPGYDLPHLPQRLADLSSGDLLFIVSQHAINYAHPWLTQKGVSWPDELQYYAVGRSTSLRLYTLIGLRVSYPDKGETSEDLLRLPALERINGKRALILRGNGGREVLEQTLRQRGVQTTYCECYRRSPIHYDGEEQGRRIRMLGIDTLVITSGEMLQQFYTLMPTYYCRAWLTQCRLIVVSKRLAILAHQLGWTDIVVANAADNDALMRVLL